MRIDRAFVALILGSSLLAVGPLLVRVADVEPAASAFWRMALAAGPLAIAALWLRRSAPTPANSTPPLWPLALLAGAFFAADLVAWHSGIVRTTTANATLFANTTAFMLAGWAMLVQRARPTPATLAALSLALAGTALLLGLSLRVSSRHALGDALSLCAALFYTGYLLVIARMGRRGPLVTVAAVTLTGALWLLPAAWLLGGDFWPRDWRPLLALALSSQIAGQTLMIFATARLPSMVVGVGLLVQPIISATLGWLVFAEALGPWELAGAAMIAGALLLIRRAESGKARMEQTERPA